MLIDRTLARRKFHQKWLRDPDTMMVQITVDAFRKFLIKDLEVPETKYPSWHIDAYKQVQRALLNSPKHPSYDPDYAPANLRPIRPHGVWALGFDIAAIEGLYRVSREDRYRNGRRDNIVVSESVYTAAKLAGTEPKSLAGMTRDIRVNESLHDAIVVGKNRMVSAKLSDQENDYLIGTSPTPKWCDRCLYLKSFCQCEK